jgi:hypothetical protein
MRGLMLLTVAFIAERYSLKLCHLLLPTSREAASIRLCEGNRQLERSLFCSSKQQLLVLNENSIHIADCDSEVLRDAGRALVEQASVSDERH